MDGAMMPGWGLAGGGWAGLGTRVLVAGAAVCLTAVALYRRRAVASEEGREREKDELSSQRVQSALDKLTDQERQRRIGLEKDVRRLREEGEEKLREIERLKEVKEQEAAQVKRQQELALQEAAKKKQQEQERLDSNKKAMAAIHKDGALCVFKDIDGVHPDLALRIHLEDAVGFATTGAHIKGRLRADYPGQPIESRQALTHKGQAVSGDVVLRDLVAAMHPRSAPLEIFVRVEPPPERAPAPTQEQKKPVKPEPQSKPLRASSEEAATEGPGAIKVVVKDAKVLRAQVIVELKPSDTVKKVKAAAAGSDAYKASCTGCQPSSLSLVFGGRVLKDHETLHEVMERNIDKSQITVHALVCAPVRTPEVGGGSPLTPASPFTPSRGGHPESPAPSAESPAPPGGEQNATNPQWMETLRKQIEDNMKLAFWRMLSETLESESPDFDWVVKLYREQRDRLCAMTPNRRDIHQEVHAALDVELFDSMIRNGAFEPSDLAQIVAFTFDKLQGLCSPARDAEIKARRSGVEAILTTPGLTFAQFVVPYLKAFHTTVDDIESDISAFRSEMARSGGTTPQSIPSSPGHKRSTQQTVSGDPSPISSPGTGSIKDMKAKLRQLGVSEEVISRCVEKRDLANLLDQALGRAQGTVTGRSVHPLSRPPDSPSPANPANRETVPSSLSTPPPMGAAPVATGLAAAPPTVVTGGDASLGGAPSTGVGVSGSHSGQGSSTEDMGGGGGEGVAAQRGIVKDDDRVKVACKLIADGTTDLYTVDAVGEETIAELKVKLAAVMKGRPSAAKIQLVHAGKILKDHYCLSSCSVEEGVVSVHAVMLKGKTGHAGEAAATANDGVLVSFKEHGVQAGDQAAQREYLVPQSATGEWLRLLMGGLGGVRGQIYFGARVMGPDESIADLLRMVSARTKFRWQAQNSAIPLTFSVATEDSPEGSASDGAGSGQGHRTDSVDGHCTGSGSGIVSDLDDLDDDVEDEWLSAADNIIIVHDVYGPRGRREVRVHAEETVAGLGKHLSEASGFPEAEVRFVACGHALEGAERVSEAWQRVGGHGGVPIELYMHVSSKPWNSRSVNRVECGSPAFENE